MMAKPITALELHYPMIHFLIGKLWVEKVTPLIYIERVIFLKCSCLEIAVTNSKGFSEILK